MDRPAVSPAKNQKPKTSRKSAALSRTQKPPELSVEDWQRKLRQQFGREQDFELKNVGDHSVFSDFQVTNPTSKNTYRVSIRGSRTGENFCSCPDFATNTLGTCKHIEFALAALERKRGGEAALRAGFQPAYSEVFLRYGDNRQVRFRRGSECPPQLARVAERYFDAAGVLRPEGYTEFQKFLGEAGKFEHDLRCYDDVLGFIAEIRDRDRRREVIDKAFPRGISDSAFSGLVNVSLYDYQREGALFAARAGRCLIGDEMGLGKTVQAIAAAEIMAKHLGVERVLIICPTSLKHQWEREIGRFTARSAQVVNGLRAKREEVFAAPSFFKITNYDTVHRDLDLIQAWSPDLVILDEAQRIKNWSTRAARNVKKITSPYAIVLTGTPLENRLEELVSIVQFVDQHRLGPTFRFLANHQVLDDFGKVVGYKNLDQIGKSLAPILIRRQKSQVLKQLPERLDKHFFVPMTPQQMVHHEENRETVVRIVARWRKNRFLSEADKQRLMIALQNMRMSCNSTYLLDHETDFGVKADELATLLNEIYEQPDAKVVIFSQWVAMHELLQRRLDKRKWDYVLFHGGVASAKRQGLVDRFREEKQCRAFLSTDAGGVGLNLQHAATVVNMDLPWNPAVLEQRIGRVHRLGQKQPVRVVNFVAQGTIEESMLSLLKFKKSLFAGALDGGEKEIFLGGSRLTRFMQSVEKATEAIPAATVEERDEEAGESTGNGHKGPDSSAAPAQSAPSVPGGEMWSGLLQTGLSLLEELAGASRPGSAIAPTRPGGLSIVRRDVSTGKQYLHLPMPSADVMDRVLQAVGGLLERFR
jgi:superfamily II DNA or RNA helicase